MHQDGSHPHPSTPIYWPPPYHGSPHPPPSHRTSLPYCRKIRNRKLLVVQDELIRSIWLTRNVAVFHGSTVAFRQSFCRIMLCARPTRATIGHGNGVVYAGYLKRAYGRKQRDLLDDLLGYSSMEPLHRHNRWRTMESVCDDNASLKHRQNTQGTVSLSPLTVPHLRTL